MRLKLAVGRSCLKSRSQRTAPRRMSLAGRFALGHELLESRRLLAGDGALVDPIPPEMGFGTVQGQKWEDLNGDGTRDPNEPGLAGVRIYADLNRNGRLDPQEPIAVTARDLPETDFDEAGFYVLESVPAGEQVIREVVPAGYIQTYPGEEFLPPTGSRPDIPPADDLVARVEPAWLDLSVEPGETALVDVSLTIEPVCVRAVRLDVISYDSNVTVENLSGIQLNGCGGDVSVFELAISPTSRVGRFDLVFIDAENGSQYATIPVENSLLPWTMGGHRVFVDPGQAVGGIDFGNARVSGSVIEGRSWLDRDGDGVAGEDEPGLAGVTIYADLNRNGQLDRNEPRTGTTRDDPRTEQDEAGRYRLAGLAPGEYEIREVVPPDYRQTFPGVGARVVDSSSESMNSGIARELELSGIRAAVSDVAAVNSWSADLELTVVWPDSCGALIDAATSHVVVGDHILVELSGQQVGEVCADVISPQTIELNLDGLREGTYHVVAVLQELLPGADDDVPTLSTVALVRLGGPGAHRVILQRDEIVSGVDFGNYSTLRPASVSGVKWLDRDGNGVRDRDEPGLSGVTIYVDLNQNGELDADEPSAVSQADDPATVVDEAGQYSIDDVMPGTYLLRELVPAGYLQTYPVPEFWLGWLDPDAPPQVWPWQGAHQIRLRSGEALTGIDFGNQPIEPSSIEGTKWLDRDGDRRRGDDEPGIAGVTIYVDRNLNRQLDADEPRTQTDAAGQYQLGGLVPGYYVVREVVPDGYEQTFPGPFPIWLAPDQAGLPDVLPFDVEEGYGIVLGSGVTLSNLDFGNRPLPEPASVRGVVWQDTNASGTREDDEPGMPGVVVYADLNGNLRLDGREPRARTTDDDPQTAEIDESGRYELAGLRPGNQVIRQLTPVEFEQTYPRGNATQWEVWSDFLLPGRALGLELLNAELDPAADGELGLELTFGVVWPDGCGAILREETQVESGGELIHVGLVGTQVGEFCTLALKDEIISVHVPNAGPGAYQLEVQLREADPAGGLIETFMLSGRIDVGLGTGHAVDLKPGETIEGQDFGNRRVERPVPTPEEMADLDADGSLGAADINLLAAALRAGDAQLPAHDLSGDGRVDLGDYEYLVLDLMGRPFGDSNLDGRFDSSDLVEVFQRGHYEDDIPGASHWEDGDWNGDGEFDSGDLVFAMQHGAYERSQDLDLLDPAAADGFFSDYRRR